LEKYLLSHNFIKDNPISNVEYYFKTIGVYEYNIYIYSHQTRIFIYNNDGDEIEVKDFGFEKDVINFLNKVIRQAKIKNLLK
jgi:hypothetical protein